MKQFWSFVCLISILFLFSACGMTQELDEALDVSKELRSTLTEQEKLTEELLNKIERIQSAFESDLESQPETGLFNEEEGKLYKNFTERETLLSSLKDGQKTLNSLQSEIQRIAKKQAVDVDNTKLELISSSLQIILNNYDSLILYMETGFEQETALYTNLPVDNLEDQGSVIYRTYGSVSMVGEEMISNMEYTVSLIKEFQTTASIKK